MAIIEELTGIATEMEAHNAAQFERDLGKTVDIEPEDGGTWLIRIYPLGFGSTDPAMNAKEAEVAPMETLSPEERTNALQNLLDFLAKFESGGNYNAHFGKAANTNPKFTSMTIRNVIDWQRKFVAGGKPSSAVGRYQIIRKTLQGLVRDLNLDAATLRFNSDLQDTLALRLLKQRGLKDFMSGAMDMETFARNVAKEWASMPVIAPTTGHKGQPIVAGQSFYAGDGLNKALVGVESYRKILQALRGG